MAIRGLLLPRRERDRREKVFLLVTRCPGFPANFLMWISGFCNQRPRLGLKQLIPGPGGLVPSLGHLTEGDQVPEACVHSHSGSSTSRSLERLQDRHTCSCLQKNLPPRKEWENLPLFSFSVPRGRHLDIFSSIKVPKLSPRPPSR